MNEGAHLYTRSESFELPNESAKIIAREQRYLVTEEDGSQREIVENHVYKKIYNDRSFWKMYLTDFLHALGLVNNSKQLEVLFFIYEHADQHSNLFIGTYKKIEAGTGVSNKTVVRAMKKFIMADLVTKVSNGVYQVNPNHMMVGSASKKRRLVIDYEDAKHELEKKDQKKITHTENADILEE